MPAKQNPLKIHWVPKYSRVDSDADVGGDQDNSYKGLLASVLVDFSPLLDTKLAGVLERIWGKGNSGDFSKGRT